MINTNPTDFYNQLQIDEVKRFLTSKPQKEIMSRNSTAGLVDHSGASVVFDPFGSLSIQDGKLGQLPPSPTSEDSLMGEQVQK